MEDTTILPDLSVLEASAYFENVDWKSTCKISDFETVR